MWYEALARNISTLVDCVTLVVVSHVVVHVYIVYILYTLYCMCHS